MKKITITLATLVALAFSGCGGGGGDSSSSSYDVYSYSVNPKVLTDDKVVVTEMDLYDINTSDNDIKTPERYFSVDIKDDNYSNKYYSYALFDILNITQDTYKDILNDPDNISLTFLTEVLDSQIKELDIDDNSETVYKRNYSIGDSFSQKNSLGETMTCNLSAHYDQINAKDKINEFYSESYVSNDYIFNDVIEVICTSLPHPNMSFHMFLQKNIGGVFSYIKDIEDGIENREYTIIVSQTVFDK